MWPFSCVSTPLLFEINLVVLHVLCFPLTPNIIEVKCFSAKECSGTILQPFLMVVCFFIQVLCEGIILCSLRKVLVL